MAREWMKVAGSLVMGWGLAACSGVNWQSSSPPSSAPQSGAPQSSPGDAPAVQPAASDPNPAPAGPVSVSIRVTCAESVNVFFGSDPKFGSGRSSRLSGNSVQSESMQPGDVVWLTDESKNGLASTSVSASTREIAIACSGITAR